MATKTVFQAGAVPQSLYDLESSSKSYRDYVQSLMSQPLATTQSTLTASQTGSTNPYYQAAEQQYQNLGGQAENLITQGNYEYQTGSSMLQSGADMATQGRNAFQQGQNLIPSGQQAFAQGQGLLGQGQGLVGAGQGLINYGQGLTGQGVSGAYAQGVQNLQNIVSQYPQIQAQLNQLPSYQAIMSTGLTPEQQAYVTQATQAQQAAVTQQMQSEGLGSSTMVQEKLGAAQQAGAATAGSLIQGNIQAATGAANAAANALQERINQEQAQVAVGQNQITGGLGLAGVGINQQQVGTTQQGVGVQQQGVGANVMQAGTGMINAAGGIMQAGTGMVNAGTSYANAGVAEQQLGLSSQTKGDDYINTIATADTSMQKQLYDQAMQGYGVLGKFLDEQMSLYGISINAEQIKGNESAASAQTSAQVKIAQGQQDAEAFSAAMSTLASLLGSTTKTSTGGGTGGGDSSAWAGREVFGELNPEWYLMRDAIVFRAPKWFRKAYIRHAREWALYLSTRPGLKRLLRTIVRRILAILTHAESGIFKN